MSRCAIAAIVAKVRVRPWLPGRLLPKTNSSSPRVKPQISTHPARRYAAFVRPVAQGCFTGMPNFFPASSIFNPQRLITHRRCRQPRIFKPPNGLTGWRMRTNSRNLNAFQADHRRRESTPCCAAPHRVLLHHNRGTWRRGWDSNPRYHRWHNGFRDRPNRPLWHLSARRIGNAMAFRSKAGV